MVLQPTVPETRNPEREIGRVPPEKMNFGDNGVYQALDKCSNLYHHETPMAVLDYRFRIKALVIAGALAALLSLVVEVDAEGSETSDCPSSVTSVTASNSPYDHAQRTRDAR